MDGYKALSVWTLVVVFIGGVFVGFMWPHYPPTYSQQWESVYSECARDKGDDATRRADCITAADRVMGCTKEPKGP